MNTLQTSDAESAAVQKTPNRVTYEALMQTVSTVEYHNPALCPHMTIAFVKLRNGYVVTGESTPADPANFDEVLGRKFAVEAAIRKVWSLEGYLLREKLAGGFDGSV